MAGSALLLAALLALLALYGSLNAPPPALGQQQTAAGLPVRLLAVSRGPQHQFQYQPPDNAGRRLLQGLLRRRIGDVAISGTAEVPADSLVLWLWIGQPRATLGELTVTDELQRQWRRGGPGNPLRCGSQPWGRATLGWVALTNFDRTAERLLCSVQVSGHPVTFGIDGPAARPQAWAAAQRYPLQVGDRLADLRLWQVRPVDEVTLTRMTALGTAPPQAPTCLIADFDVVDRRSGEQPGQWRVEVVEAVTSHGERLDPVQQTAGLVWLDVGRRPSEIESLSLQVRAEKHVRDTAFVVFRGLELPGKTGASKRWNRQADEPFPSGVFHAVEGNRPREDRLTLTLTGRGPAGTTIAGLTFVAGLDQAGRPVRTLADREAQLEERRDGPPGVFWRWTFSAGVSPSSTAVALAFKLVYRRTSATSEGSFIAAVLPVAADAPQAAFGALLEPRRAKPQAAARWFVRAVLPKSRAAGSGLRVGDEVLSIDALPPPMLPRVLLRHAPGEAVPVTFRRGGQTATVRVPLDGESTAPPTPAHTP
ncbi:MAG: PDZ domain-containing protein [Fimbriimonadaceae bacterium]|nr:PDZ domain-containing protein [Fimbriimonadaceae bacterium]